MLRWRLIALLMLLVCAPTGAYAQRVVIVGENDVIGHHYDPTLGINRTNDDDYTQGLRASIVFEDFNKDPLAGKAFDFLSNGLITAGGPGGPAKQQIEWIVGQSIFTPDQVAKTFRLPGERPFGGWLYTGGSVAQETGGTQLDSFEVLAGVVGPDALGEDLQKAFHTLNGSPIPFVNGYEIHNEPGLLLAWDRRWKIGTDLGGGFGADIIPSIGLTAGNVFTYASAGALFRIGRSLSSTWGPTRIEPGPSGASFFSSDPSGPSWGFAVFGGVEGRAVARNIFLDGNTWVSSPSVTKKVFVGDVIEGIEFFTQAGSRIAFSVTERSKEYTTQPYNDIFGSVEASFKF
jgi:lipid A 3-O-deacylase